LHYCQKLGVVGCLKLFTVQQLLEDAAVLRRIFLEVHSPSAANRTWLAASAVPLLVNRVQWVDVIYGWDQLRQR